MKKYFLLAAAAATVLAVSCNKEKNQPKVDPTPGTEIEDNTPQPIRFGTNIAEVKAPLTKAAIENHGWDGENLYIYAFGTATNGSVDVATAPLIGSATAGAPAKAPLASSTPTGNRDAITLEKDATTHEPYYYEVKKVYNFFGYYVGDATLGAMANYQLPITIDGTNDIMVATTDKIADYMAATPAASVSLDKVYSDVSARDNVVPDLMFKHQLSRFKFETKYAGTGTYTDVAFKSLTLKSYNQGTLTVAAADPQAIGFVPNTTVAKADLALTGFTAYSNTPVDATAFASATHPGNGDFEQLGESILAVPEGDKDNHAKYKATLSIGQINTTTDPDTIEEQDFEFDIDFEKIIDPLTNQPIAHAWAEPGKQYTVKILVYGFEKIEITVSLEKWGEGGETQINPDADDREAVTIVAALTDASIAAGTTTNVTVTSASTPSVADLTGNVQYSSSNTRVATVSNTGVVTGVNPGICKIYVVVPGITTGDHPYMSGFVALDLTVTAPAYPVVITCADQTINMAGANVNLASIATFSTGYAGTVTYALKTGETYTHATVTSAGVVSIDGSAAAGDTFQVTISAEADATNNFQAATKDVTFTVALPVPAFAELQDTALNADVSTSDYTSPALFTSCQYGTTPTDVDPASIFIEVTPTPSTGSITYNNADKTITVALGTEANTYAVTLKVAASAGVHQAVDATPFDIVVTD